MKALLLILLLMSLKPACSRAVVNLRMRQMSSTVRVAHGYFTLHGRYTMFVGHEEPITVVKYGSDTLFVQSQNENPTEECIVEMFERSVFMYAAVTVFERTDDGLEYRRRIYYSQGHLYLQTVDKKDFVYTISSDIFLFFDVKATHKHPFMAKATKYVGMDKEVTYTIAREYKGLKINEPDDIQYVFGIAYDATMFIVVGYRIMDEFMNAFDSVVLTYRYAPITRRVMLIAITFHTGDKAVVYQRARHLTRSVWNAAVHHPRFFMDIVKYQAYQTAHTLRSKNIEFDPITLDVSQQISPELFGVEITEGKKDDWDYELFRVEPQSREHFKIKRVLDMVCPSILVMTVRDDATETIVETYRRKGRCTLVVTSFMPGPDGEFRETRIFDRKMRFGVLRYEEVWGDVKAMTLQKIESIQPMLLLIPIDKSETSLYSRDRYENKHGVYLKISINAPDGRAIDSPDKYRIGRLSQKRVFDHGNIPHCTYGDQRVFFTNHLRTMNAVVANTNVPLELEHMDPELYAMVYRAEVIYA